MTEQIQNNKDNSVALLIWDRLLDTVDMVLKQCTSGRWLLTVAAGVCLIHFAWINPNNDKLMDILKDIVIFYFVVRDTVKTTGGSQNVSEDKGILSKTIS